MVANIDKAINKYEFFIYELKEDLNKIEIMLQGVNAEISDLLQQKQTLKVITDEKMHPNGFKTQINLGCNFFMEASVTDTSKLLMNIGLNHFIEFSLQDAKKYLDIRIKAFEEQAEILIIKSAATKAHMKCMLFAIGGLQDKKPKKNK